MATARPGTVTEGLVARTDVTHLGEVAETIRADALASARSAVGPLSRHLALEQLFGRPEFIDRFRYGLSKGVALTLAANDLRIQEVHLFDADASSELESVSDRTVDPTVHLLAVVDAHTAALDSFTDSLDRAIVEALRELPSELFSERKWILDVKVVTLQDIAANSGYACLLNSIHAPSLRIWER